MQQVDRILKSHFLVVALIFFLASMLSSCDQKTTPEMIESWKAEIVATEKNFSDLAASDGIAKAFLTYAAEDAVLMRNNQVISGWEAIRERLETYPSEGVGLTWKPDFVDVSSAGDLGYTYGTYVLTTTDSLGSTSEQSGIFHTVWKRQSDGNWKFVWD